MSAVAVRVSILFLPTTTLNDSPIFGILTISLLASEKEVANKNERPSVVSCAGYF